MKQFVGVITGISLLFFSAAATAQAGGETQLGVIVGSLTGISAKQRLSSGNAIVGALAYSFDGRNGISLHGDYIIDPARTFNIGEVSPLNLYYGLGLRVSDIDNGSDRDKVRVGVRAPIGLNYVISNPDIEVFGELVPVLDVAPSTDVWLNAGLGVRFRF